jgi:hypothetical protein
MQLTQKQETALDDALVRVEAMTGSEMRDWSIEYKPETRPGRGHDIIAWTADSDYMANQYMDPYGNGTLVIARTEVIHNDADEDHFDDEGNCECEQL